MFYEGNVSSHMIHFPVAAAPGRLKRYDATWLLENVGSRFVYDAGHDSLTPRVALAHQGLTQDDLDCEYDAWQGLSTGMGRREFQPPYYFAPVANFMRALAGFSSITTPITTDFHDRLAAVRRDEVWQVSLSLPTDFVKRLCSNTSCDVDQIIFTMAIHLYGNKREAFIRDWVRTMSRMEYDDTSSGQEIPNQG
jgi:hypothetical protein